ncbi:MAG: GNAT family N-acetyltransferase [Rhodoferax sp.]|nr:GNAT family N-acetyltransferase [Rhodoferax sp.]
MKPRALFSSGPYQAREMRADEVPQLQRFFEDNPIYFEAVNGQGPTAQEAQQEFDDLPPAEMPFDKRWMLLVTDSEGEWVAMAGVLSNFLVPGVWHIGLFIVATRLHGTGVARALYDAMEQWIQSQGAQWMRLGAVEGWNKAENFWRKMGYTQVRTREAIAMGLRVNNVRVMVKPLTGGAIADYLHRVKRDNPGAS